jgi:hypothetical protein
LALGGRLSRNFERIRRRGKPDYTAKSERCKDAKAPIYLHTIILTNLKAAFV